MTLIKVYFKTNLQRAFNLRLALKIRRRHLHFISYPLGENGDALMLDALPRRNPDERVSRSKRVKRYLSGDFSRLYRSTCYDRFDHALAVTSID